MATDSTRGERKLDLLKAIDLVKADKKKMAIFCIVGLLLGLSVAFDTPRKYKSSVVLAPESTDGSSLTSNLSSLASMVGMDMRFGGGSDAIYPEIYPDVINSNKFLVDLFPIEITTAKGGIQTDYYEYLQNHTSRGWWTYPKKWLTQLVAKLKKDDISAPGGENTINPFWLNKQQDNIAQAIKRNIDCSVDKKTSVITIQVTDQDPLVAATMADSVREHLQVFITDYRTQKARNDLEYMEMLFSESRDQYVTARQQYAAYSDANRDLILETFRAKQEELENDMQLKFNAYTQIYEQLQIAKARVQERTPAFTVVQPASVPLKHSNRSKLSVLFTFIFLAFSVRAVWLFLSHFRELYH